MQRLGDLPRSRGDGAAVLQLRGEHFLLHAAREDGEKRQNDEQYQRKPRVFHGDHREDRDDPARVRRHADDPRVKQRLHGVDVARKARGDLAGVLRNERRGGQRGELSRHFRTQRARHLLPEQNQKRLLRRGKHALQRKARKIRQRGGERQRSAVRQSIDHARQ